MQADGLGVRLTIDVLAITGPSRLVRVDALREEKQVRQSVHQSSSLSVHH